MGIIFEHSIISFPKPNVTLFCPSLNPKDLQLEPYNNKAIKSALKAAYN